MKKIKLIEILFEKKKWCKNRIDLPPSSVGLVPRTHLL